MLDRNKLVHAVIWPQGNEASSVELYDSDGVLCAEYLVQEPVKGSEISKMIPDGYTVACENCTVVSMAGKIIVSTKAPFDTAVVTERAEISFEERMQRLERLEKRREKRMEKLAEENRRLLDEAKAARAAEEAPGGDPKVVTKEPEKELEKETENEK